MSWLDDDEERPRPATAPTEPARTNPPSRTSAGGARRARPKPRRRGRWIAIGVLGLLLLGVVGVVLVLPLLTVRAEGTSAREDLVVALDALRDGDLPTATSRVASARASLDTAQGAANGFQSDVLGVLPVAGGAVDDVRHLVDALDGAVSVAELGVDLYPQVLGEDAGLVRDGVVDLTALVEVTQAAETVTDRVVAAHASLDAIEGTAPFVGESIGDARDAALEQVVGIETTLEQFRPLLEAMPSLLGAEGPVTYLVAVMNPSELRASGGATLSLGEMTIDAGRVSFGDAGSTTDFTDDNAIIRWEPVPGDPWYAGGDSKLVNATFSPNWTTGGEELLRAWEVTTGTAPSALVAMDVEALARLFRITGPIEVPGYGTLNATNLVEKLVGSYDRYRDADERKALNEAIIPLLRDKLLEGGRFVQKAQSLVSSAKGRHVVTYFRDPEVQAVAADLGLAGDLSTTAQDYIGLFTQNTNASKVDFWAQREVSSDVTLAADGSAEVTLTATFANPTPPYALRDEDPRRGYNTRWSFPVVVSYLPVGAEVRAITLDGAPLDHDVKVERDRTYLQTFFELAPTATRTMVITYRVPQAAVPHPDGGLVYALDVDPQGTVNPTNLTVTLRLPEGFHDDELVGEWTVNPDLTLTLADAEALVQRTSVRVVPD